MISLSPLKTLMLTSPSHQHRQSHFSAASGLVHIGDYLYIVADDENHLGVFLREGDEQGFLFPVFAGDLPLIAEERKAEKPDLEVLTLIPPSKKYPYGALLALGSGSKKTRERGVIVRIDDRGNLDEIEVIDLSGLYDQLKEEIGKINIEGAVIIDGDIILFQRGNKKNNVNATLRMSLTQFYKFVFSDKKSKHKPDITITHYELGDIGGVPLCFTDATALPNGVIVFSAAAENTSDAYLDGVCMGSIIGIINNDGTLHSTKTIDKLVKAEGIEAQVVDAKVHLLLVTDADDETTPAQLYSAELLGYPFNNV